MRLMVAGIGPSNELSEIMWMERQSMVDRVRKLKSFGGEKHAAITFKLSYELDLPLIGKQRHRLVFES